MPSGAVAAPGAWTVPAFARAMATAFSKSSPLHNSRPTGFCGLMLVEFQWVRSRMAVMVGLVVPISLPIWPSLSSG